MILMTNWPWLYRQTRGRAGVGDDRAEELAEKYRVGLGGSWGHRSGCTRSCQSCQPWWSVRAKWQYKKYGGDNDQSYINLILPNHIQIVEKNPSKFRIDATELAVRRSFIQTTREEVGMSSCLAFIFWWRCLPGFGKASTLHITMCKECPLCQKILISLRKEFCQKILMVRWNRWRTGSASPVREKGLRWVIIDIFGSFALSHLWQV